MHTQGMEMLSDFAKGGAASKDCKFERLFFFFFFFFTGKHHLPRSCQAALERLRISIRSLFCNYFSCEVIR